MNFAGGRSPGSAIRGWRDLEVPGLVATIGVVALVVAVTIGWIRHSDDQTSQVELGELCGAYESMVAALLNPSLSSQAARAKRAEVLADLAMRYPDSPQANAESVPVGGHRLRDVLDYPYARVNDVFAAARPVAVACGLDWRTGSIGPLFD